MTKNLDRWFWTAAHRGAVLVHRAMLALRRAARRHLERTTERCEAHGCDTTEVRRYMAEHPVAE